MGGPGELAYRHFCCIGGGTVPDWQAMRRRGDPATAALARPYRGLLQITGRLVRQAAATAAAVPGRLETLSAVQQRAAARALAVMETICHGRDRRTASRSRCFGASAARS